MQEKWSYCTSAYSLVPVQTQIRTILPSPYKHAPVPDAAKHPPKKNPEISGMLFTSGVTFDTQGRFPQRWFLVDIATPLLQDDVSETDADLIRF